MQYTPVLVLLTDALLLEGVNTNLVTSKSPQPVKPLVIGYGSQDGGIDCTVNSAV